MSRHIADGVVLQDLVDAAKDKFRELVLELDFLGEFDPFMYVPPGPVAQAFINSDALTAIIMGPLGGGKTTACMYKRLRIATLGPIAWHPVTKKPTRMCRAIVLRDTFRQTEKTVLASWQKAFPKTFPGSSSIGGNDRPYAQTLQFKGTDGVNVEAITEFAGLGEQAIGEMLKGTEYSCGWLNEVDTHAEGSIDDLEQRLGRYPSADMLLSRREIVELEKHLQREGHLRPGQSLYAPQSRMRALIGDMNAPTIDSWTYPTLVTNRKPDRAFFQQPSGMADDAENLPALPEGRGYYQRIVDNQDDRHVQRMVHNKFGYSQAGKAVHPSFDHQRHVASSEIELDPRLDLHIGIDISTSGLSPAAVFGQAATRIRFIDELYEGHGVGPARFAEALKKMMQERYPNVSKSKVKLWLDPASEGGADRESGQLDSLQIIEDVLKVAARIPGNGSNELGMRLAVIDKELRGYMEPHSSLLISPRCKLYIGGIAGKYRFKKKPATSTNEYEDAPEKAHPWSDLQDAGQYLTIGIRGPRAIQDLLSEMSRAKEAGKGSKRWSSQDGEGQARSTGWKSQSGFDPHKAGAK